MDTAIKLKLSDRSFLFSFRKKKTHDSYSQKLGIEE